MAWESMRIIGWGQNWKEVEKDVSRNLFDIGLMCVSMRGEGGV